MYKENPKLFDKKFQEKSPEGDFASVVWASIIIKLLTIKKIIKLE